MAGTNGATYRVERKHLFESESKSSLSSKAYPQTERHDKHSVVSQGHTHMLQISNLYDFSCIQSLIIVNLPLLG
jgi:hypothetical protein